MNIHKVSVFEFMFSRIKNSAFETLKSKIMIFYYIRKTYVTEITINNRDTEEKVLFNIVGQYAYFCIGQEYFRR